MFMAVNVHQIASLTIVFAKKTVRDVLTYADVKVVKITSYNWAISKRRKFILRNRGKKIKYPLFMMKRAQIKKKLNFRNFVLEPTVRNLLRFN